MPYTINITDPKTSNLKLFDQQSINIIDICNNSIPTPKGFIVTTESYQKFINSSYLLDKINYHLKLIDKNDPTSIQRISNQIRQLIISTPIPKVVANSILNIYESFDKSLKTTPVVVSCTTPYTKNISISPLYFMNVRGEATLLDIIKEIWANNFSPQHISRKKFNKIKQYPILVTKMLNVQASGFAHTLDIQNKSKNTYTIEAIYGYDEYLKYNYVEYDEYRVDINLHNIVSKQIGNQEIQLILEKKQIINKEVNKKNRLKQKLSDENILKLIQITKQIRKLHPFPQTIEWILSNNKLYILNSTNYHDHPKNQKSTKLHTAKTDNTYLNLPILDKGMGVSRGIATGKAKIIRYPSDFDNIGKDHILITQDINPTYFQYLSKVKGVVSTNGKFGSHTSIILRELGIPGIVNVLEIIKKIKNNQIITIDGQLGVVYFGKPKLSNNKIIAVKSENKTRKENIKTDPKLKIYANMPSASNTPFLRYKHADGVSMIKGELLLAKIGIHPKQIIANKGTKYLSNKIYSQLVKITNNLKNKPIFYHLSDITSNLGLAMIEGNIHEQAETNPELGFRGAYRLIHSPKILKSELDAIFKLKLKHQNINLVIPMIRSTQELKYLIKIIKAQFKIYSQVINIYLSLVSPSNMIMIPEYISAGVKGFVIDLELLSKLMLGIDPHNNELNSIYNPLDPSIFWLLKHTVSYCVNKKKPVIVCSDMVGIYPYFMDFLKKINVSGVGVSPDLLHATKRFNKLIVT